MSRDWPTAAQACFLERSAGLRLRPRRPMPRPTAPEETTMTSTPSRRSAAMPAARAAIRSVFSCPIPEVSTPVPSLTTMRRASARAGAGMGEGGRGAGRRAGGPVAPGRGSGDGEQVLFLGGEVLIYLFDGLVGEGLDFFFGALGLVLGELGFFDRFDGVAADVADLHAAFLGEAVGDLDEFLAAFAAHLGEGDADEAAVHVGVEAEVGHLDALGDGLHEALVPGLDDDHAGVGRHDGGAVLDALHGAVGLDLDALDHGGRG